ncbi:MAG: hypothetical protein AAGI11_15080 [Pseudomonadota bacterium]
MSREVRRVPADWEHPRRENGNYIGLFDGYLDEMEGYQRLIDEEGLEAANEEYGGPPIGEHFMPDWPEHERTHWMMYETTSEGTPISPAFETPEALAEWLASTGASSHGKDTATYEQWLSMIKAGWAPSAMIVGGEIVSGVEALISSGRADT